MQATCERQQAKCDELVKIRKAQNDSDFDQIYSIICEQNRANHVPLPPITLRDSLRQYGIAANDNGPIFETLLAETSANEDIVGFAIYYQKYSTWKGAILWIESFEILPSLEQAAGECVRGALMRELVSIAARDSMDRIEWSAIGSTEASSAARSGIPTFSCSFDLTRSQDWQLYRLAAAQFDRPTSSHRTKKSETWISFE